MKAFDDNTDGKPRTPWENPPSGTHLAFLYRVALAGFCPDTYQGVQKMKSKIHLAFEVWPKKGGEWVKTSQGQPFVISPGFKGWMTLGTYKEFMQAWVGTENPEIEAILGQPALLSIQTAKSQSGSEFSRISSIAPPMEGLALPEMGNPALVYNVHEHDPEAFDKLPNWIKNFIVSESETYQRLLGKRKNDAADAQAGHKDDDIPF